MDIIIQADGFTMNENLRAAVEAKIGRVEQYAQRAVRARVRVRKESARASDNQYKVLVQFEIPGNDVSAEESGPDALSALDLVSEKIERRLRKVKTARLARRAKSPRAKLKK